MCSFQGAVLILARALLVGRLFGQSKCLQFLGLFPHQAAVGLIFHHGLGALLGALFLPETCFGTGSRLIRSSSCQCLLLFGGVALLRFPWRTESIRTSPPAGRPALYRLYICSSLTI